MEAIMSESTDKQEKFFGAYVDRDVVLRLSRWTEGTAWVVLTFYALTWLFSVLLFVSQFLNGLYFLKGSENFLSTFSLFSPYLQQFFPVIFFFFGLQPIFKILFFLFD